VREIPVTVREIARVGQFRAIPRFGYGSEKESVLEAKCLGYGAAKSSYGAETVGLCQLRQSGAFLTLKQSDYDSLRVTQCLGYGAGKCGYGAGIRWNTPAYWRVLRTLFG
jgi:hypothetical protein